MEPEEYAIDLSDAHFYPLFQRHRVGNPNQTSYFVSNSKSYEHLDSLFEAENLFGSVKVFENRPVRKRFSLLSFLLVLDGAGSIMKKFLLLFI